MIRLILRARQYYSGFYNYGNNNNYKYDHNYDNYSYV